MTWEMMLWVANILVAGACFGMVAHERVVWSKMDWWGLFWAFLNLSVGIVWMVQ